MADLLITNFNRNFSGVSSTSANVLRQQVARYDLALVGRALPGCPAPISVAAARRVSRLTQKPFAIWHVRRNTEMRAAIWARDVLRLPIRIVFTSAAQRRHSALPRWLIARMDAVIATTEAAARFMGDNLRATVPHGVDCDLFKPGEHRSTDWARLGYGGARGVATIGRIRPEKGTDTFVLAMFEALPHLPDVTALVIGKAAPEHQGFLVNLERQIDAAGLKGRILFPGEGAPEELPRMMRALSLVVQLPRYEGYGMVPLEGMASGVPFVGSNTGYYQAFSGQGVTGRVVPVENASSAAREIRDILASSEVQRRMAEAARDTALTHFSVTREADGINAVYEALWSEAV